VHHGSKCETECSLHHTLSPGGHRKTQQNKHETLKRTSNVDRSIASKSAATIGAISGDAGSPRLRFESRRPDPCAGLGLGVAAALSSGVAACLSFTESGVATDLSLTEFMCLSVRGVDDGGSKQPASDG
jgi:hypothetical protein